MTAGWFKTEKRLLSIGSIRNTDTGVKVVWTNNMTLTLLYMLDRYEHFNRIGKTYFDNQDSIAEAVGLSVSGLKKQLKLFQSVGAVVVQKQKRVGGGESNRYIVKNIFNFDTWELTAHSGKIIPNPAQDVQRISSSYGKYPSEAIEDEDSPF